MLGSVPFKPFAGKLKETTGPTPGTAQPTPNQLHGCIVDDSQLAPTTHSCPAVNENMSTSAARSGMSHAAYRAVTFVRQLPDHAVELSGKRLVSPAGTEPTSWLLPIDNDLADNSHTHSNDTSTTTQWLPSAVRIPG